MPLGDILNRPKSGRTYPQHAGKSAGAPRPSARAALPVLPPCEHEGAVLEYCKTCGSGEGRHVRDCAHPNNAAERCTREYVGPNVRACAQCPDHTARAAAVPTPSPPRPVGRMHLLYHVYPRRGSSWRWRVAQVLARWPMWDGHTITVGTDATTEPADAVRALLPPDARVIAAPADARLGETQHWHDGWEAALASAADDDIILRAHAKGATRDPRGWHNEWADWLLHASCDYPDLVREQLAARPVCGPLLITHGSNWQYAPGCDWHHAGSWYWVRAGEARSRWKHVVPTRYGVENWPGLHWKRHEAGSLFTPPQDLPEEAEWRKVAAAWIDWSASHRAAPRVSIPPIHVVTPVTRPHLLPRIGAALERLGTVWYWHKEPGDPGTFGGPARTRMLAEVADPDALVYFLDDDTLPHPHLAGLAAAALVYAPDADGWTFGQLRSRHGPVMWPEVKHTRIDTGSVLWRRRALEGLEWGPGHGDDYHFIAAAVGRGARLEAVPAVGSLYNALR